MKDGVYIVTALTGWIGPTRKIGDLVEVTMLHFNNTVSYRYLSGQKDHFYYTKPWEMFMECKPVLASGLLQELV